LLVPAQDPAEHDGERATAGANVGDGHAGLQLQDVDKQRRIVLGGRALLRDLLRIGLLGECPRRDDQRGHDERNESMHGDLTLLSIPWLGYFTGRNSR
jgi:hypothetical protein